MPRLELFESSNDLRLAFELHANKSEVPVHHAARNLEYPRIRAERTSNQLEFLRMKTTLLPA